jgi:large repetitive protein
MSKPRMPLPHGRVTARSARFRPSVGPLLEALEPRAYLSNGISETNAFLLPLVTQSASRPVLVIADFAPDVDIPLAAPASALIITSATKTKFTVGESKSFAIITSGSPAPGLSEKGALPASVTFTDNGNGTATLSGAPQAGTGGKYDLTIAASNGIAPNVTQAFVLRVNQAPDFISAGTATFTTGTASSLQISASGFPLPLLHDKTALPQGLTFVDNGNGTATLSGQPAGGTGGTYQITFKANNAIGAKAKQVLTLTVDQHTVIRTDSEPSFVAGATSKFKIKTTGFPTAKLTESGALPSGLTFRDNQNGIAKIFGSPTAGSGGIYEITVIASNGQVRGARKAYSLAVNEAPIITSAASADFIRGTSGSFTVNAVGFPTPILTEEGALPNGITFTDDGDGTATLLGNPGKGSVGTYTLTFVAKNGTAPKAREMFVLTVEPRQNPTAAPVRMS